MATTGSEGGAAGAARAERLIGELEPPHDPHPTAVAFARIIIGLFPDWFDFAPGRFAVLAGDRRGLKLVVTGPTPDLAVFPTSDSLKSRTSPIRRMSLTHRAGCTRSDSASTCRAGWCPRTCSRCT